MEPLIRFLELEAPESGEIDRLAFSRRHGRGVEVAA